MYEYRFLVTRVIDGDTVQGLADLGFKVSVELKIRLADVDTPEIFRPKSEAERELGYKAKEFVENQILNKEVILKTEKDKTGKYGRYIGHLFLKEDNTSLNQKLIENKLTKDDVQV